MPLLYRRVILCVLYGLFIKTAVVKAQTVAVESEFPIVAWFSVDAAHNARYYYKQMSKAGFNYTLPAYMTKEDVLKALYEARGTGIKLIVDCQEVRNADKAFINRIKNEEALGMYYLKDEPTMDYFHNLAKKVDRIKETDGQHAPYINLLPIYAGTKKLKSFSYPNYINSFIKDVKSPILSYDHYPFVRDNCRKDFFDNLRLVSEVCKKSHMPFWCFVRTLYDKNYYMMDEGRLRFQVFCSIAYGAQGVQYFTYGVPKGRKKAILNSQYKVTDLYEVVKRINSEIHLIGTYSLGAEIKQIVHCSNKVPSKSMDILEAVKVSGKGVLMSIFDKCGKTYLMIVNTDYQNAQRVQLSFKEQASNLNKRGCFTGEYMKFDKRIAAGDWLLFLLD